MNPFSEDEEPVPLIPKPSSHYDKLPEDDKLPGYDPIVWTRRAVTGGIVLMGTFALIARALDLR